MHKCRLTSQSHYNMIHLYRPINPRPLDMTFKWQYDSLWEMVTASPSFTMSLNPIAIEGLSYTSVNPCPTHQIFLGIFHSFPPCQIELCFMPPSVKEETPSTPWTSLALCLTQGEGGGKGLPKRLWIPMIDIHWIFNDAKIHKNLQMTIMGHKIIILGLRWWN